MVLTQISFTYLSPAIVDVWCLPLKSLPYGPIHWVVVFSFSVHVKLSANKKKKKNKNRNFNRFTTLMLHATINGIAGRGGLVWNYYYLPLVFLWPGVPHRHHELAHFVFWSCFVPTSTNRIFVRRTCQSCQPKHQYHSVRCYSLIKRKLKFFLLFILNLNRISYSV